MEIRYKGNTRIFLMAFFGILMVLSSIIIHFVNPLKLIVDSMTILKSKNSIIYNIWVVPPYDIKLKIFIFNVTNYDAFLRGEEKLHFEQVGPYVFREILEHTDAIFNDNGTLSYIPKRTMEFIPELSVGLPENDKIFVPNIPLLGIASMLHQSSMFLNLGVLSITRLLNAQPILNLTVYDYFYGYEDKLVLMASRILPNWISFEKLGIIDRMFDEGNNTLTINVDPERREGSASIDEQERGRLYSISKYNGLAGLEQWSYRQPVNNETVDTNSKCNMLEGAYDGTLFPPNIPMDSKFRLYRKFVCRTIPLEYDHTGMSNDNFKAYFYKISDNFLDRSEDNPDNDCYCKDKEYCLPKGFGDTTPCYYGFPTAISRPHFLGADEKYLKKIDGLTPNDEDHGTNILINPDLGVLLGGVSRMQVNLVVRQTKYNSRVAPFNNMILPLFWSEMSTDKVPVSINILLTLATQVGPIAQSVVFYLFALVGTSLIATAGILVFLTLGVTERSPSISGYSAVRIIPVIRRESTLNEFRRLNNT